MSRGYPGVTEEFSQRRRPNRLGWIRAELHRFNPIQTGHFERTSVQLYLQLSQSIKAVNLACF